MAPTQNKTRLLVSSHEETGKRERRSRQGDAMSTYKYSTLQRELHTTTCLSKSLDYHHTSVCPGQKFDATLAGLEPTRDKPN